MRPAFRYGFAGGALLAGAALNSLGRFPPRDLRLDADSEVDLFLGDRDKTYPQPDGRLFFDKLSSVYASGNRTRDDAANHIRIRRWVPREVAEAWVHMCPAEVYEIAKGDHRGAMVDATPSNCVQCGAISAKGGRLTPPEGGDGPEYTVM
jgi:electron-transferring-flavoprotein dehydrogenase